MKIFFITHAERLGSASMPRFAGMLADGMRSLGHEVEVLTPPDRLSSWARGKPVLRKWLGYIDDYVFFFTFLRRRARKEKEPCLFVIVDQALGCLVPAIAKYPHVIHCHDFLAQRSALGEIPENRTGVSGRLYQRLIRRGFGSGKNFISISEATRSDLKRFLSAPPNLNVVVHNGLNYDFKEINRDLAIRELAGVIDFDGKEGFLLHVGGNQWYKNREGVIEIYKELCQIVKSPPALWMVGAAPTQELLAMSEMIGGLGKIRFLSGLSSAQVRAAYNLAELFIFPSLEEGFGWPIVESMACGTPVLTTAKSPMTEVGGAAAIYLRRKDSNNDVSWALEGAMLVSDFLLSTSEKRRNYRELSFENASHFKPEKALKAYEAFYAKVLNTSS